MYSFATSYWVYVAWTFGVIIFLVNTFQLYFMFKDPKVRQSKSMVLIFNLTMSDILFSLFFITHTSLEYHWGNKVKKDLVHYNFKTFWEKHAKLLFIRAVYKRLTYRFSILVSLLAHVSITCDRLYSVLRPIKYWQYKSRKYLIIAAVLTWIVAFIISAAQFLYEGYVEDYAMYLFLKKIDFFLSNLVPITIGLLLIFIYGFIQWKFKRNKTKMIKEETTTTTTTSQLPSPKNSHNCRKKQERIFMKMSFAITTSFCICWMPICIFNLQEHNEVQHIGLLCLILTILTLFSPIFNTILYFPYTRLLVFRMLSKLICGKKRAINQRVFYIDNQRSANKS